MSICGNFISSIDLVTPRQLVSIKALSTSLDINAKSECLRLFDCDLRKLTVTSAAHFIADLRGRLIRQKALSSDAFEWVLERPGVAGSTMES